MRHPLALLALLLTMAAAQAQPPFKGYDFRGKPGVISQLQQFASGPGLQVAYPYTDPNTHFSSTVWVWYAVKTNTKITVSGQSSAYASLQVGMAVTVMADSNDNAKKIAAASP